MGGRHDPGVLERNAEIEDVGVRVERIVRRVNNFGAFQGYVLSDLHIHATRREPRQMKQSVGLDDVKLIAAADRLIELTQKMRVPGIRAVHRLELESEIVSARFGIERTLNRQQRLVHQQGIGLIGEEVAKINAAGRPLIEGDPRLHMAGYGDGIPPGRNAGTEVRAFVVKSAPAAPPTENTKTTSPSSTPFRIVGSPARLLAISSCLGIQQSLSRSFSAGR